MTASSFRIAALPADDLDALRRRGTDALGNATVVRVDDTGGAPLRCCLRDSRAGERLLLVAYSPFDIAGPYAEVGPVFVHADSCDGYPSEGNYPDAFRARTQVFRAYHRDGTIAGGTVVAPEQSQEAAISELFADPDVAFLHSRNMVFGCYMFAIHRSATAAS